MLNKLYKNRSQHPLEQIAFTNAILEPKWLQKIENSIKVKGGLD